jgi:hypothetical protein
MAVDQVTQIPFYLDWKFWSAVVAFAALVLSQLPPLHILFRRAKLEAETYSHMHLTHKVGNPNAQLHMILNNTGGRELRIRQIELQFRRGNEDSFSLPAKNYLQAPGDKEAVLLASFKLKPGEEWAHIVNFLNFFSRQDEKLYRQLESNLRHDIVAKREALQDKNQIVAADDANVAPLLNFFQQKFRWVPGEYEMTLSVKTEPANAMKDKRYRITLFESDSQELADYQHDYKYGFGVSLNSSRHIGVIVPVSEA